MTLPTPSVLEYHAHGDPLCQWHFGNTPGLESAD
jgi:protein-disulfide isomerase-like protein with CxxC motif